MGTRNLKPFVRAGLDLTVRILPLEESFADCTRLGIRPKNIIAAWPPFSVEFNTACMRQAGASVLVAKDSGREGGLQEKLEAAAAVAAAAIIIRRPAEPDAIHDLDQLVERLAQSLESARLISKFH